VIKRSEEIDLDEAIEQLLRWNAETVAASTRSSDVMRSRVGKRFGVIFRGAAVLAAITVVAAFSLALVGLRNLSVHAPGASLCPVSEVVSRAPNWRESGGPDLWVVGERDYVALGSLKLFLRVSPDIHATDGLTVYAESPPSSAQSAPGSLSSMGTLSPLDRSEFEEPPPADLPGRLFFVVQSFPVAGCWQIHLNASGRTLHGPVVSVAPHTPDPVAACNKTDLVDNVLSSATWSLAGDVRRFSASRASEVRVQTYGGSTRPSSMEASRLDPPEPHLDATARIRLPPTDESFPLRLGPGCWSLRVEGSSDRIVIAVGA
jgi:hypothetical protein